MTEFARLAGLTGLSDTALADLLNVRPDTVRHWRTGRRDTPLNVLFELEQIVDAEVSRVVRK